MSNKAQIVSTGSFAPLRQLPQIKRGQLDYPMSAAELIEFGKSPLRWLKSPPADPDAPPGLLEVIRCTLLANGELKSTFVQRPETFQSTVRMCPNCKSESPAKVCRTCNLTRVVVPAEKKWSGNSDYCIKWAKKMADGKIGVVAPDRWQAAQDIAAAIIEDPDCNQLLNNAGTLAMVHGHWDDPATKLLIPVQETIDLIPAESTNLETAIASLVTTSDSSPGAWALACYASGAHIRAALKRRLFNSWCMAPRDYHLWILAERNEPHIISRRCASIELLNLGDSILELLLASYASCLSTGFWPAFDRSAPSTLEGFTPVFLEPWMTQGQSPSASYFAIGATATPAG